jgi:hypothetical protein|tara:strand:- start:299 stop:514 length:216 start_codon:yes stop_codon:yes gene_type:complete
MPQTGKVTFTYDAKTHDLTAVMHNADVDTDRLTNSEKARMLWSSGGQVTVFDTKGLPDGTQVAINVTMPLK